MIYFAFYELLKRVIVYVCRLQMQTFCENIVENLIITNITGFTVLSDMCNRKTKKMLL